MGSALSQIESIGLENRINQRNEERQQIETAIDSATKLAIQVSNGLINDATNKELRKMQQDYAEYASTDEMFKDADGNYVTDPSQIMDNYNNWVDNRLQEVNGFIRGNVSSAWKNNDTSYYSSAISSGMKMIDQNRQNAANELYNVALTTNYDGQDVAEQIKIITTGSDISQVTRAFTVDSNADLATILTDTGRDNNIGLRQVQYAKGLLDLGYSVPQVRQAITDSTPAFAYQTFYDNLQGAYIDELNGGYNIDGFWNQTNEYLANNELPGLGRKLNQQEINSVIKTAKANVQTIRSAYDSEQEDIRYNKFYPMVSEYENISGNITTTQKLEEFAKQSGLNLNALDPSTSQAIRQQAKYNDTISSLTAVVASVQGDSPEVATKKMMAAASTMPDEAKDILRNSFTIDPDTGAIRQMTPDEFSKLNRETIGIYTIKTSSGNQSSSKTINAADASAMIEENKELYDYTYNMDMVSSFIYGATNDTYKAIYSKVWYDDVSHEIAKNNAYMIPVDATDEEIGSYWKDNYERIYTETMNHYGLENFTIKEPEKYTLEDIENRIATDVYDYREEWALAGKDKYYNKKLYGSERKFSEVYQEYEDELAFRTPTYNGYHAEARNDIQQAELDNAFHDLKWEIISEGKDSSTVAEYLYQAKPYITEKQAKELNALASDNTGILKEVFGKDYDLDSAIKGILKSSTSLDTGNIHITNAMKGLIGDYVTDNAEALRDKRISPEVFNKEIRNIVTNSMTKATFTNGDARKLNSELAKDEAKGIKSLKNIRNDTLSRNATGVYDADDYTMHAVNSVLEGSTTRYSSADGIGQVENKERLVNTLMSANIGGKASFKKNTISEEDYALAEFNVALATFGYPIEYDPFADDLVKEEQRSNMMEYYSNLSSSDKGMVVNAYKYTISQIDNMRTAYTYLADNDAISLHNGKMYNDRGNEIFFDGTGKNRKLYANINGTSQDVDLKNSNTKDVELMVDSMLQDFYSNIDVAREFGNTEDGWYAYVSYVISNSPYHKDKFDGLKKLYPTATLTISKKSDNDPYPVAKIKY